MFLNYIFHKHNYCQLWMYKMKLYTASIALTTKRCEHVWVQCYQVVLFAYPTTFSLIKYCRYVLKVLLPQCEKSWWVILSWNSQLLPPAYVVRREGNSFTLFVCPHLGGVPISHNALQHFPECHEAVGGVPRPPLPQGGYLTGYPPGGVPGPPGGTWPGTPPRGYPDPPGGTWPGTPRGVRVPPGGGGVPDWVHTRGGGTWTPPGGGTQVGQHKEYSLHGGRYASCVHAGGLSC